MTKVNLKKAADIQKQLGLEIKKSTINPDVTFKLSSEKITKEQIEEAQQKFINEIDDVLNLKNILFNIRTSVGKANAPKINELLTEDAKLAAYIRTYEEVIDTGVEITEDLAAINKELVYRNNQESRYNTILVSTVSKDAMEELNHAYRHVKSKKHKIKDKIVDANVKTKIDIAEEDYKTLERYGIV